MSEISPGLPEDQTDVEFMMGKSKPVHEVQFLGESPQSEDSANAADSPWFEN